MSNNNKKPIIDGEQIIYTDLNEEVKYKLTGKYLILGRNGVNNVKFQIKKDSGLPKKLSIDDVTGMIKVTREENMEYNFTVKVTTNFGEDEAVINIARKPYLPIININKDSVISYNLCSPYYYDDNDEYFSTESSLSITIQGENIDNNDNKNINDVIWSIKYIDDEGIVQNYNIENIDNNIVKVSDSVADDNGNSYTSTVTAQFDLKNKVLSLVGISDISKDGKYHGPMIKYNFSIMCSNNYGGSEPFIVSGILRAGPNFGKK